MERRSAQSGRQSRAVTQLLRERAEMTPRGSIELCSSRDPGNSRSTRGVPFGGGRIRSRNAHGEGLPGESRGRGDDIAVVAGERWRRLVCGRVLWWVMVRV